jgi:2-oxoglutarate dehydrogenase complex dehydrogenase (E1) component-like enzyme
MAASDALVVWEAQFGDFVNGAQVMRRPVPRVEALEVGRDVAPHAAAARTATKARARSTRAPGSSGSSSSRPRATSAMKNCTTAAQYFHVLRRQARRSIGSRPLVMITPKSSAARQPQASFVARGSRRGRFEPVLDDPATNGPSRDRRPPCCSAPARSTTISSSEADKGAGTRPICARLEQLYSFPERELTTVLLALPERPRGRGVVSGGAAQHGGVDLRRAAAPDASCRTAPRCGTSADRSRVSPAEGYTSAHKAEQARIVGEALGKS